MQPEKKAARPIPPAHEAQAEKLRREGFNVWAKADGSIGWAKPKPKAAKGDEDAAELAARLADPISRKQAVETPAPKGVAVGAIVAVAFALVGVGLAIAGVIVHRRNNAAA